MGRVELSEDRRGAAVREGCDEIDTVFRMRKDDVGEPDARSETQSIAIGGQNVFHPVVDHVVTVAVAEEVGVRIVAAGESVVTGPAVENVRCGEPEDRVVAVRFLRRNGTSEDLVPTDLPVVGKIQDLDTIHPNLAEDAGIGGIEFVADRQAVVAALYRENEIVAPPVSMEFDVVAADAGTELNGVLVDAVESEIGGAHALLDRIATIATAEDVDVEGIAPDQRIVTRTTVENVHVRGSHHQIGRGEGM